MIASMSRADHVAALLKESKGKVGRRSKSVQHHLYTLTFLELVQSQGSRSSLRYLRTELGDRLCQARATDRETYQRMLSSILLRNETTGPLFRKFLKIVRKGVDKHSPVDRSKLRGQFVGETVRTLVCLGKEAGLISEVQGLFRLNTAHQRNIEMLTEFANEVISTYRAVVRKQDGAGPRTIYVEIGKIRNIVLSIYGSSEERKFNQMFTKLLDSPEGRDIHLYGAAPQWLPGREDPQFESKVFRYKEKIYAFMSIS
jgi:hypothetical protein